MSLVLEINYVILSYYSCLDIVVPAHYYEHLHSDHQVTITNSDHHMQDNQQDC